MESSKKLTALFLISMFFVSSANTVLDCGYCGHPKPAPVAKAPTLPVPDLPLPKLPLPTPLPSLPKPTIPLPTPLPSLPKPTLPNLPIPKPTLPDLPIPKPTLPLPTPLPSLPKPTLPNLPIPKPTLPNLPIPKPTLPNLPTPLPSLPKPTLPDLPIPKPPLPGLPTLPVPIPKLPVPVPTLPPPTGGAPAKGKPCPTPVSPATCPIDILKLGACVDFLGGLVHVGFGDPAIKCCPYIAGLAELEAAVCLCTTLKVKLLNLKIYVPIALQILVSCGKTPPPGYTCAI